ncbi:MAG: SRPBCC family protein [Candidatus Schekmanbacteria bacterium]|nr:SRPBCC family protein [Candidatus Schekmanbacteria bacterium]
MRFVCNAVGPDFLDSAPQRIVNAVEIPASAAAIFAVFEDAGAWPRWFSDIVSVEWTSPRPFGVGTTRTVRLQTMTVDERFIIWEQDRRFAFYLAATSLPLVNALCEDYVLEPLASERTRFVYTVAYDPRLPLLLAGPLGRWFFGRMFSKATQSLAVFMRSGRAAQTDAPHPSA